MAEKTRDGVGRRTFLKTSTMAAATAGLVFGDWTPARAAALPTRKLGRTGIEVTTVSFGAILLNDQTHERVLEHAIDQGINLVHVSPGYQNGRAIEVVGAVMKRKRDQVAIALKTGPSERGVEDALRKLNTDHVEILIPGNENAEQIGNPASAEAYKTLQDRGLIKYTGFATHKSMAETITAATASGIWDTTLVAYNLPNREALNPILAEAVAKQKMGFLIMKSSNGLDRRNPDAFAAGIRNLLANEACTSLTLGMNSIEHVDRNIKAILEQNAAADRAFARYAAACAGRQCANCGRCTEACPAGVAISEYVRAEMYQQRGDTQLASELLASLPARQTLAVCRDCGACNQACPRQLNVLSRMHDLVGLA